MKRNTQENKPFIYIRATGEKIPVSKEVRDAYYGEADRIRMKEQAHGHCVCPQNKAWSCDGDCFTCEYRCSGDLTSPDIPIDENALLDTLPSESPAIESIIEDRDLLDRLFARLRELDPDADIIIAMWMDDDKVSDRAIAKALGRPQHTFVSQMRKFRTELRRIRGY